MAARIGTIVGTNKKRIFLEGPNDFEFSEKLPEPAHITDFQNGDALYEFEYNENNLVALRLCGITVKGIEK